MTIEIREEQFERAKLVLSKVPKGIERAMASAIKLQTSKTPERD